MMVRCGFLVIHKPVQVEMIAIALLRPFVQVALADHLFGMFYVAGFIELCVRNQFKMKS